MRNDWKFEDIEGICNVHREVFFRPFGFIQYMLFVYIVVPILQYASVLHSIFNLYNLVISTSFVFLL